MFPLPPNEATVIAELFRLFPGTREVTDIERFVKRVAAGGEDECWLWLGPTIRGYGRFSLNGKTVRAHRFAYEALVGRVPDGMVLDHLCRVRHCVNPAHLEVVTNRENVLRGVGHTAENARKTHCPQGHPLSGDNVRLNNRGSRVCRTCAAAWMRHWRAEAKTETNEQPVTSHQSALFDNTREAA